MKLADNERILLEQYASAKKRFAALTLEAKNAEKALKMKERLVVDMLLNKGAVKTAHFEGIGFARLRDEELHAINVPKQNEPQFFEFVRKVGSGDIIKESIHYQTLKSFLTECLVEEVELPSYVYFETKRGLTFYDRSEKKSK